MGYELPPVTRPRRKIEYSNYDRGKLTGKNFWSQYYPQQLVVGSLRAFIYLMMYIVSNVHTYSSSMCDDSTFLVSPTLDEKIIVTYLGVKLIGRPRLCYAANINSIVI